MPETLKPTPQDRRSRSTQAKVIRATIACLDRLGYAETTFARIQERAGVSRGAITHHFPTRQTLVAATAMELLARALDPVERRAAQAASPEPVRDLITRAWGQVVNAAGGRAMVEILVACRTDAELFRLLETRLHDWDQQSRASVAHAYVGADPAPDDAELLWSMTRNFLRGLVLHERFVTDPSYLARMVDRFAGMMESQLTPLPAKDAP